MVKFFLFIFYVFKFIKSSVLNVNKVFDECCHPDNLYKDAFCSHCQQEDFDFLRNLEYDKFLMKEIDNKYQNNLSNPNEPFILYYSHKKSTFNHLFIFVSTVLNNLISMFDLKDIEKVFYRHDNPEKFLILNCNQIFYCFWAISSLPKSRFKPESEIENVSFEEHKIENFISILNNFNYEELILHCNGFYWKNIPSFEEYDIKSKIKYLMKQFTEIKRFQKLFSESILILIFCYELPDNFLLNNKYQLIENFISKMAFLFEVVKHEDKIENEELFLINLNSAIKKSNKIICFHRHTLKLKNILDDGKINILNRIKQMVYNGPKEVAEYWHIIGFLRGRYVPLQTYNYKWAYDHTSCVAKFQDFMVHFMGRINEMMIKKL